MAKRRLRIIGFWERFEEAVKESGLSKTELSKRMGCRRQVLYDNDSTMSPMYMAKFCAITGTSADWLLGLSKEKELRK